MGHAAYQSSKGAVNSLTRVLAIELASSNIRVNAINPTAVDTPLLRGECPPGMDFEEWVKSWLSIPLGRWAKPEDIAYAALYLASDESSMLTGTCLNVDGGEAI